MPDREPEEKTAGTVPLPMVSPTWGLPVTVTGRSNTTSTRIASPNWKMSPCAGWELKNSRLTTGAAPSTRAPTLRRGSAATAAWVSTASVVPPAPLMVPPASRRALAAMLTPSVSSSPSCTW